MTYHLPPPSVAVCSKWARTLKSNCCGRLAQISDISSLFQHTDTSTNTYKPSYILDATTSSIQNVFMQLISSISNPFINFLVTTAFVLSLICSIILTTWTLQMCVSLLINKVKNRTHPPNNNVPEV